MRAAEPGSADHPRAVTSKDILSLRDIGGTFGTMRLSPDAAHIAFQIQQADPVRGAYKLGWFVMPSRVGGSPVHVGDGGEVMLNPQAFGRVNGSRAEVTAEWSPDGKWIAYLKKAERQVQLWLSSADGRIQKQITRNEADVIDFRWHPRKMQIHFQVGRARSEEREQDRIEGNRGYLLDDRFVDGIEPRWFPCGEQIWGGSQPVSQACVQQRWIVDIEGNEREAGDDDNDLEISNRERRPKGVVADRLLKKIAWDAKHRRAAWLENTDPKNSPGIAAPLTLYVDGQPCGAPECRGQLKGLWWSGEAVVFLRDEGHGASTPALYSWQPARRRLESIYRVDGTLESCDVIKEESILCLEETPARPRRIVSINLRGGARRTLFDPNPEFAAFDLGAVERIDWHDRFGNETFGHLVYPPGYQRGLRYPLVIVQYRSRGFLSGGVGNEYPIYPLAAKGFLVLSVDRPDNFALDSRCTPDSLDAVGRCMALRWKDGYQQRSKLSALEIVLDQLDRRGLVDPARIGVTGLSDGADTVNFALFNSNLVAAAAISGDWSPDWYNLTVNEELRAYARQLFMASSGQEAIEKWKRLSVTYNVDNVTAPLLMQVADAELMWNLPQFTVLKEAGKPVEAYVFPDEYHIKWQPQHKWAIAERAIDWFQFWLQGYEDPAIAKRDQYVRWRKLRDLRDGHRSGSD